MKYPIYIYKTENNYFSQCLQMDTVLVLHLAKLPLGLWIGEDESQSPFQGFDEHATSSGMCVAIYTIAFECFNFPQKSHPFFSFRTYMVYYIFPPIISCPKLFWVFSPLVVWKAVPVTFLPCLPWYAKQIHILYQSFKCPSGKLWQLYTIICK